MAAALRTMAAAMATAALVGLTQATENPLPPCLEPFQPFVYSGCFQEGNGQILPYRSHAPSDGMTVEKCVAECKGNGYRYAGLVYYGNCYCGQTVQGVQVTEDQCSFPCNGNGTQTCGGDKTFSIYQDPTFQPIDEVTIEDYDPLGCWTDDSTLGRALVYRQDQVDSATMTTEKCLQACRDGGFPFAGTEYGGECYCGVVIGNDTHAAPASECDMACNGNPNDKCGGRSRLNLFVADELLSLEPCGYEPPVSSSATPPPTTTSKDVPTTTSSSVCTTTSVIPPKCEWRCGKWCSSPLPDWDDVKTCKAAWSNCVLQVASCFKHAGWPDVLECFDFGEWCADVSRYCDLHPHGKKHDFWGSKPPKSKPGHDPKPTTVTVTTACPPATTTTTMTTTTTTTTTTTPPSICPVPTPTNICTQPSNPRHGYAPGNPVGGIEMPVVTCNDLREDWPRYPFKGYTDADTRRCKKYERGRCGDACRDACKEQYEDCVDVYAEGCKQKKNNNENGGGLGWLWPWWKKAKKRGGDKSYFFAFNGALEKRTWWWKDDYGAAVDKCKAQYSDCLKVNKGVTGAGKCPKFGDW
ncbi:hypothetical protein VTK26DRAFT_841 [Humicola hyalothermophila]